MASATRKQWVTRLLLALAIGLGLPFLPSLLNQGVGPGGDLSGRLGLEGGVSAGTFAILFLAGILTSLTPCVYPLIPITVSVFGARQNERRARSVLLSATYVGGIAAMYSGLGLFAALSGKAFGSALSSRWVVTGLALFLFALAASMFGAFELTVPHSVQQRLQKVSGKGFGSAFGMGLVAGVVAAPCTGPVLAGVLAFVATRRSALLGFWMLFTYALGVGVLFFVIGATSLRLPRSGGWMDTVKSVFGVALVAVGVGLVLPFVTRPAELPFGLHGVELIAGLGAFAAVLAGALSLTFHDGARAQVQKAVALAVLVAAIGLRLGWAGSPRGASDAAGPAEVVWLHDEAQALAQAKATGKLLLIDFGAEWCAGCKELDQKVWPDPEVKRELARSFIPLKIDATKESDENERLLARYGVTGMPAVLVIACNGNDCPPPPLGERRIDGYLPVPEMLARLRKIAGAVAPGAATPGAAIAWLHDEARAVEEARKSGKALLVDFGAEWCAACKELDLHTWTDPAVQREVAARFVPLRVDATNESEATDKLTQKYAVPGLPTVLMMACKDTPPMPTQAACAVPTGGPGRITGFVPPADMLERLRSVQ